MKGALFDAVGRRVGAFASDRKGTRVSAIDPELQRRLDGAMDREWGAPGEPIVEEGGLVDTVVFGSASAPEGRQFFTTMLRVMGLRAGELEFEEDD